MLRNEAVDAYELQNRLAKEFWRSIEAFQKRGYVGFEKEPLEAYQAADKKYKELREKLMNGPGK